MIPNLFFPQKVPKRIPEGMQKIVDKVNKCKTKDQAVRLAYDELTKTHSGSMFGVLKHFPTLFIWDLNKLWKRKKLTCTGLTFLLRVILMKSRHFNRKNVKHRVKIIGLICPHVYLEVNTEKKCLYVDVWGKAGGVPFGKRPNTKKWIFNHFKKKK